MSHNKREMRKLAALIRKGVKNMSKSEREAPINKLTTVNQVAVAAACIAIQLYAICVRHTKGEVKP